MSSALEYGIIIGVTVLIGLVIPLISAKLLIAEDKGVMVFGMIFTSSAAVGIGHFLPMLKFT